MSSADSQTDLGKTRCGFKKFKLKPVKLSCKRSVATTGVLIAALGLFFGLFFGLNYKEILKHGWPIATCTVLSTNVQSRFCCFSQCTSSCSSTAFGAPQCSVLVNQLNAGYNPTDCMRNSTACPDPTGAGQTCDDGYHCCQTCCQTCQRCSQSCHGSGSSHSCTQSCSSYQCNCTCCLSTPHRSCTVRCPTCYSAVLGMSYTPSGKSKINVSYSQDFSQDQGGAESFATSHAVGSSQKCYYNKKNLSEVSLDVSFTPWKWAVTAVFGMAPLLAVILFIIFIFGCTPFIDKYRFEHAARQKSTRELPETRESSISTPASVAVIETSEVDDKEVKGLEKGDKESDKESTGPDTESIGSEKEGTELDTEINKGSDKEVKGLGSDDEVVGRDESKEEKSPPPPHTAVDG